MLSCLALYRGITAMALMSLLEKAMLEWTKENFYRKEYFADTTLLRGSSSFFCKPKY